MFLMSVTTVIKRPLKSKFYVLLWMEKYDIKRVLPEGDTDSSLERSRKDKTRQWTRLRVHFKEREQDIQDASV